MRQLLENILLKIVVCGESQVGKSLLCQRLSSAEKHNELLLYNRSSSIGYSADPYKPTIGLDMAVLKRRIAFTTIAKIHLWDTSGDERYTEIIRSYYRTCCGAIVVIDMNDDTSYQTVKKWIKDLKSQRRKDHRSMIISVFANVHDGFHENNRNIKHFCENEDVYYSEVELLNNENVEHSFSTFLKMINDTYIDKRMSVDGIEYLEYTNGIRNIPTSSSIEENNPFINHHSNYSLTSNKCCSIL